MGLAVVGDSLLLVWNPRLRRLSHFDVGSGKFVSSQNLSGIAGGMFGANVFGVDFSGILYFRDLDSSARQSDGEIASIWTLLSADGNKFSTFRQWDANAGRGSFVQRTVDGFRYSFHPRTITVLYPPGGFVYGRNDQYQITVVDAKRMDTLVIRRTHSAISVKPEERREWDVMASERQRIERQRKTNPRVVTGLPFEASPTPATKPVFRSLFADNDGRIWIEMYVAAEKGENALDPPLGKSTLTWREPTVFEALTRDGSFLGRVRVPGGPKILAARGMELLLLEKGPDDEPLIRGYRITR
jgi:hypothetical protein